MTKIIKCSICGKEFETDKKHIKYCSLECKEQGRRNSRRKWSESHPDYMTRYMRIYNN